MIIILLIILISYIKFEGVFYNMKEKRGLVHVYTGDGKGKTTAAIGLATRAVGQGFKVFIVQFMKGGAYTGEFIAAKNFLPNVGFMQYGRPCIKEKKQLKLMGISEGYTYFDFVREDIECGTCRYCFLNDKVQDDFVKQGFNAAKEIIAKNEHDLIILDEINVAMHLGFLNVNEVVELIKKKPREMELVLTGRDAPKEIKQIANLVTEMKMIKHYFEEGVGARRGIEY